MKRSTDILGAFLAQPSAAGIVSTRAVMIMCIMSTPRRERMRAH